MRPLIRYDPSYEGVLHAMWPIMCYMDADTVSFGPLPVKDCVGRDLIFFCAAPDLTHLVELRKVAKSILIIDDSAQVSDKYVSNQGGQLTDITVFRMDSPTWTNRKDWTAVQGFASMDRTEGATLANVYAYIVPGKRLIELVWDVFYPDRSLPRLALPHSPTKVAVGDAEKRFIQVARGEILKLGSRVRFTWNIASGGITYARRGQFGHVVKSTPDSKHEIAAEFGPILLVEDYQIEKDMSYTGE